MKNLLFPAVAALFASTAAHAALAIDVFDNGASIGTAVSTTSNADLSITTDPAFDIITVDATGAPLHSPDASLSSVTLALRSASSSGVHTLTVDVFQTGFRLANNESTFNVYNFVGYAGPTTESTFAGPTTTLPEILLDTATFPAGTMASTVGPLSNGITPIYADGSQYVISFFPNQGAADTIELAASSPELSTWAMMLLGFAGFGYVGYRRHGAFSAH
jgi:hypothetical protein